MFQNISKSDLLVTLILGFVVMAFGYYYSNPLARNLLWLNTYPVRAEISVLQISCTANSPGWLADILKYQTRNNNAPANQIAYVDQNGKLHHCENGYIGQYPLLSDRVTEQTRFRYASVTKLWTADAILSLIKEGRLSLDTPLSSILLEVNRPKDSRVHDITIGQLLLHRAGFDRYSGFGNDMFGIGQDICPNNLMGLNDITLGFDPNSKTSYSNLGYCILGEVISRLNQNKPYKDIIASQYDFADTNLEFVSNSAMPDEVTYNYVETGVTGHSDIYSAFDYDGLASAAGLSGNAIYLAQQMYVMAAKPKPNILSDSARVGCNPTQITECYGYAMIEYQPNIQSSKVHYRDGSLLGLASLVAVSEKGEIVALLSNGNSDTRKEGSNKVKMMIYEYLIAIP